jgi:hypothetical protein
MTRTLQVVLGIVFGLSLNACCSVLPWLPWCAEEEEEAPRLVIDPVSLDFGTATDTLVFTIANDGEGTLDWSLSEGAPWLDVGVSSGTTTSETDAISVYVNRSASGYGSQAAFVRVMSNGGDQDVQVRMERLGGSPYIQAREGNGCSQNNCGGAPYVAGTDINFRNSSSWENDEARSFTLSWLPAGARIMVYDDPDGRTNDDWTEIYVKQTVQSYCVPTFENSYSDAIVDVTYHPNNGLDGKVSHLKMR